MKFYNIFGSDFRLPEKVCIVAPGINGKDYYRKIPSDYYQIALSKAVLSSEVNPGAWMMNAFDQDWFDEADRCFHGIRIFRKKNLSKLNNSGRNLRDGYYFDPIETPEEMLDPRISKPVNGLVRGGGTIAGCAIQIAYNFGAKDILLCGVDMSGDRYWDGSINRQPRHGEIWSFAPCLQSLINMLSEKYYLRVSTISPTKLNVEQRVI